MTFEQETWCKEEMTVLEVYPPILLENEIVFKAQEKDGTEMWNARSQNMGQVDFWAETCRVSQNKPSKGHLICFSERTTSFMGEVITCQGRRTTAFPKGYWVACFLLFALYIFVFLLQTPRSSSIQKTKGKVADS